MTIYPMAPDPPHLSPEQLELSEAATEVIRGVAPLGDLLDLSAAACELLGTPLDDTDRALTAAKIADDPHEAFNLLAAARLRGVDGAPIGRHAKEKAAQRKRWAEARAARAARLDTVSEPRAGAAGTDL